MLTGKNVIITGCSRGIGKAMVEQFAAQNAHVLACCRSYSESFEEYIKKICEKYAVEITPLYFDITDVNSVKEIIQSLIKEHMSIDVLVNNAGIAKENLLFSMTKMETIRDVFEVNFFAQTNLLQYVSRIMMRQKQGSIINLSSIAAIDGEPAQYEYAASKAAIIGATKSLAIELGKYGIRVNAIAPGLIETDMLAHMESTLLDKMKEKIIMGRVGQPKEIANTAVFLASDMSSYITGQVIRVDGGVCGNARRIAYEINECRKGNAD